MRPLSLQPASPVLPLCNPQRQRYRADSRAMHGQPLSVFCASSVPSAATGADHSEVIQRSFSYVSVSQTTPEHSKSIAERPGVPGYISQRRKRPHTWWVRPWLTHPRRMQFGDYSQLLQELRLEDEGFFYNSRLDLNMIFSFRWTCFCLLGSPLGFPGWHYVIGLRPE